MQNPIQDLFVTYKKVLDGVLSISETKPKRKINLTDPNLQQALQALNHMMGG